jgi:hypothetical protein
MTVIRLIVLVSFEVAKMALDFVPSMSKMAAEFLPSMMKMVASFVQLDVITIVGYSVVVMFFGSLKKRRRIKYG